MPLETSNNSLQRGISDDITDVFLFAPANLSHWHTNGDLQDRVFLADTPNSWILVRLSEVNDHAHRSKRSPVQRSELSQNRGHFSLHSCET